MNMPFGKYKGQSLEDLPTSYIQWLLENANGLTWKLTEELENQLKMREGIGIVRNKEGE